MDPALAAVAAPSDFVFQDGLGERRQVVDPTGSETLEVLCLRSELTSVPSFEFALRERVSRLASFRHAYFGRVRSVDRLNDQRSTLALVSDRTAGVRLSDLLAVSELAHLALDINAALCLIRQLVPAIATLHENARDAAHGAIAPERIVIGPNARLVVVEHVMGAALEQLRFSHERYWKDLRIALPKSAGSARFDHRADITQVGVVALSLILGRPLREDEYPLHIAEAVASAWAISARGGLEPLPAGLRTWLARTLQLEARNSFTSALEAREALDKVLGDSTFIAAPAAVEAFLVQYREAVEPPPELQADPPPPPKVEFPPIRVEPVVHKAEPPPHKPEPVVHKPEPVAYKPEPVAYKPEPVVHKVEPPPVHKEPPVLRVEPKAVKVEPPAHKIESSMKVDAPPQPKVAAPSKVPPPPKVAPPVLKVEPPPVVRIEPPPVLKVEPPAIVRREAPPAPKAESPSVLKAEPMPAPRVDPFAFEPTPAPKAVRHELSLPAFASPQSAAEDLDDVDDDAVVESQPQKGRLMLMAAAALIALVLGGGYAAWHYGFLPGSGGSTGTVSVNTNPPGAQVVVDGEVRGVTPVTLTLKAGTHTLDVRGNGEPRTIPVTIVAGSQMSQYIELPKTAAASGQLHVRSEPPGAAVSIDGVARGTAPVTVPDLAPGEHTVSLESDRASVKQSVTIEAGITASLVVPLTAADTAPLTGWITVTSPVEMQLFESNRLIGTSQSDRVMMPAGKHEIQIVNEALGYRVARTVQVPPGKVAPIKLELPKGTIALNAVPWAEVWIDGAKAGETPIGNLAVTIGPHEVIFRHPDLGEQRHAVMVALDKPARLSVDLRKK